MFYLLAKQKKISFIPKIVDFDCDKLTIRTKRVGISLEEYCDKYDCELFILNDLLLPNDEMGICWQRYYLFDILEANEISEMFRDGDYDIRSMVKKFLTGLMKLNN